MRPLLTTNLTYMTDSTAADDKKLKLIKVGMVVAHVIKTLFSLTNWFTFFFFTKCCFVVSTDWSLNFVFNECFNTSSATITLFKMLYHLGTLKNSHSGRLHQNMMYFFFLYLLLILVT